MVLMDYLNCEAVVGDSGRDGALGVAGAQLRVQVLVGDHEVRGDDHRRLHHARLARLPSGNVAPVRRPVRPIRRVVEFHCAGKSYQQINTPLSTPNKTSTNSLQHVLSF